jgi:hypothetical protein
MLLMNVELLLAWWTLLNSGSGDHANRTTLGLAKRDDQGGARISTRCSE